MHSLLLNTTVLLSFFRFLILDVVFLSFSFLRHCRHFFALTLPPPSFLCFAFELERCFLCVRVCTLLLLLLVFFFFLVLFIIFIVNWRQFTSIIKLNMLNLLSPTLPFAHNHWHCHSCRHNCLLLFG